MGLIARFLGTVFAILLTAYFVPGFLVDSFYIAAIVALVLGILNVTIKPILTLLTLPLNLLTLGLFSFVINAALILFIASFVDGFSLTGTFSEQFVTALLGGALIAVVQWVFRHLA